MTHSYSHKQARDLSREEWENVLRQLRYCEPEDFCKPSPAHARWIRENQHRHDFYEVLLCLSGTHTYGVEGQSLQMSPGMVAILPPQSYHDSDYSSYCADCVDFWLHLLPSGAVTLNFIYHRHGGETLFVPVRQPAVSLMEDFRKVSLLNKQTAPAENRKARLLLHYVLYELVELLMETDLQNQKVDERNIIDAVKRYIADHLTDRLELNDLAKAAGYSRFHFHRMFLEAEGITPRLFVEGQRLKHACDLLKKGHSVTSAALDSGFATSSQFSRVFKKLFRSSPSEWLKSL